MIQTDRAAKIRRRVEWLGQHLGECLATFDEQTPFRYEQYETHVATIQRRMELGSAAAALEDPLFLELLYSTLRSWRIGMRASILLAPRSFCAALRRRRTEITGLDNLAISDQQLQVDRVCSQLWRLIDSLAIVENKAKLVPCSKALHHLLPNLVVPMDRAYTQTFFGWHNPEFQGKQDQCFETAFRFLVRIARQAHPMQYVGTGWHTSQTKVLDNAIIGWCILYKQEASS